MTCQTDKRIAELLAVTDALGLLVAEGNDAACRMFCDALDELTPWFEEQSEILNASAKTPLGGTY